MTAVALPETRTVTLKGELGKLYGETHRVMCRTPGEALAIIRANHPGLTQYLIQAGQVGIGFSCRVGGKVASLARLECGLAASQPLEITPVPMGQGDGKGVLQIIGGIALIALSFFIPGSTPTAVGMLGSGFGAGGAAGFAATLGLSLTLGGVAQLISPTVSFDQQDSAARRESYLFQGPGQRTVNGAVKNVIYGTVHTSHDTVSLGVSSTDYVAEEDLDLGTQETGGYQDGGASPKGSDEFDTGAREGKGAWGALSGGKGGGKGGGSSRVAKEAPDDLRSIAYAEVVDVLGEGELHGPVDQYGNDTGSSRIGEAIFLEETPLQNPDGSFNFRNVIVHHQPGTPDQGYIPGFADTRATYQMGIQVKDGSPVVATIQDTTVDAIEVTARLQGMSETDSKTGDVTGSAVEIAIEAQYDGGGYNEIYRETLKGKNASSPYERTWRFDLSAFATSANIRMVRITPDSDTQRIRNDSYFGHYTEVTDEKLNHPNTAKIALRIDAEQFGSVPTRVYRWRGLKVRVPTNYDPILRKTTGTWDGTWKYQWTDNPAWCWMDLLTHSRYGLGRWVSLTQVLGAALYEVAAKSDVLVSQGRATSFEALGAWGASDSVVFGPTPTTWIEEGDILSLPGGDKEASRRIRPGEQDPEISSGTYYIGVQYRVSDPGTGGADFTGAGAKNAAELNEVFTAKAGSITWGGGAKLQPLFFQYPVEPNVGPAGSTGDRLTFTAKEPRHSCNLVLDTPQDAYRVLQDMASIFHGMIYYAGGQFHATADHAKDATQLFANADVEDGAFRYESSAIQARHTVAVVGYNEPTDLGRIRKVVVEEPESIGRWGHNEKEIQAVGCSSASEATRQGLWLLMGGALNREVVTFKTGLWGTHTKPGEVFLNQDQNRQQAAGSGRIISGTTGTLELDREVTLEGGTEYKFILPDPTDDGDVMEGTYTPGSDETTASITLTVALPSAPPPNSPWIIEGGNLETRQWLCLAVRESEGQFYEITGLEYDPEKYTRMETFEQQGISDRETLTGTIVGAPSELRVETEFITTEEGQQKYASASWTRADDPTIRLYQVHWRFKDGDWNVGGATRTNNYKIPLTAAGQYSFRVFAENNFGYRSGPAEGTFQLSDTGSVTDDGGVQAPKLLPQAGEQGVSTTVQTYWLPPEPNLTIKYVIDDQSWISSGTITVSDTYEIIDASGGADFTIAGAADNIVGTTFVATGQPTWGTGTLARRAETDPAASGTEWNGNLLKWTEDIRPTGTWIRSEISKIDSVGADSPIGTRAYWLRPTNGNSGEIYQDVDLTGRLTEGTVWTGQIYLKTLYGTLGDVTYRLEERGGAAAVVGTEQVVEIGTEWTTFTISHTIQDASRTTIRMRIFATKESSTKKYERLYCWGIGLNAGQHKLNYTSNDATPGGTVAIALTASTLEKQTLRARAARSDGNYGSATQGTYETVSAQVAPPEISPAPGGYTGTSYPIPITLQGQSGVTIKYTTNGSDPAVSGITYTAPFNIVQYTLVRAIGQLVSKTDSDEALGYYSAGFNQSEQATDGPACGGGGLEGTGSEIGTPVITNKVTVDTNYFTFDLEIPVAGGGTQGYRATPPAQDERNPLEYGEANGFGPFPKSITTATVRVTDIQTGCYRDVEVAAP